MSTSSLETRNLTRSSGFLNLFALSALPLLMVIGLLIALTGCTAPSASFKSEVTATAVISESKASLGGTEGVWHIAEQGGRLAS